MKVFIIDKIKANRELLKDIIQNNDLGFVIGEGDNLKELINVINEIKPNLVLFEVYNELEGYTFIKVIKETCKTKFIRISDVTSKAIVEKSYRAGVDYYIYKPINEYEITTIIRKVKREIEESEKLRRIQKLINDFSSISSIEDKEEDLERKLNHILLKLGIIGEKGSQDIKAIIKFIIKNKLNINDISIRELCINFTLKPKNMEQKIRRSINIAMINMANLGIEDYMNEVFLEYSNTLFNFEQVKKEMDYIRGKSTEKGSINMKKFLSGLYILCENYKE